MIIKPSFLLLLLFTDRSGEASAKTVLLSEPTKNAIMPDDMGALQAPLCFIHLGTSYSE
jgi:hypothetical protein